MTNIDEIAPDVFRISTYIPEVGIQFNQFLVRDAEPLLYHTGMSSLFPVVYEAVARVIDPATLRWISFSHFEADECGSLNKWLEAVPQAQGIANFVGTAVNLDDFAIRPVRPLMDNEVFETGRQRFRFLQTPHVPHCWDAGMLYEETNRVLFTSDLFHQMGEVEALTSASLIDRASQTLQGYQASPFKDYQPYTPGTQLTLRRLADLRPDTLATMHGSSFSGDSRAELLKLNELERDMAEKFYPVAAESMA
jgi:flavorubredoxin